MLGIRGTLILSARGWPPTSVRTNEARNSADKHHRPQ